MLRHFMIARRWLVGTAVALALAASFASVAAQTDHAADGVIFTDTSGDYTVIDTATALLILDPARGRFFTLYTGDNALAFLGLDALPDSLDQLTTAFSESFGGAQTVAVDAAEPVVLAGAEGTAIPFSRDEMIGAAVLARYETGQVIVLTGVAAADDETAAAEVLAAARALVGEITVGAAPPAPPPGSVILDPGVIAALPPGFRAAPPQANGLTNIVILDPPPTPDAFLQVSLAVYDEDDLAPEAWKTQFFAGLALRAGDDAYDAAASWVALRAADPDADPAAALPPVEVYRALSGGDEAEAFSIGYLIDLADDRYAVVYALAPNAEALTSRQADLDALALSVVALPGGE